MTGLKRSNWLPLLCCTALFACGPARSPENIEPVAEGGGYQAQYRTPPARIETPVVLNSARINAASCTAPLGGQAGSKFGSIPAPLLGERLSRNDLLDVRIGEDEVLTGRYVVSGDGTLKLPFLDPVPAQGRSPAEVERSLRTALLRERLYDVAPLLSVRVADFSGVTVGVSGAVFEPHAVEIGGLRAGDIDRARQEALGASTDARSLAAAIRAVGGIRPDADLSAIELVRGGSRYRLDLRGVYEGVGVADIMLLAGDEVVVPTRRCFQDDLMRPSPVSPAGVSLFLSNLTQPASNNASSAIGRDVREIPWGTRFMQAVVDANCVGGSRATSASRSAVLFTRNPVTGVSTVIERDIEDMLRRPDRDDYDPYLLPGDAIACYDSAVTNIAEVGRVLGIVGAASLVFE
ncbi:polysaccharide biosynthesis/export family protein [Litorisediminicola beolgyonensis]|uniref:Polysaccharide biosynthesis/export family protein n=1 Tax=Litorisediminicola beolgyonensis TaxID=1173614 RepID=A0ABW3ZDH5_9RHOB